MSLYGPVFTDEVEELLEGIQNYGLTKGSAQLPLEELSTAKIISREDKSRLTLSCKIITLELPSGARYTLKISQERYAFEDDPLLTLKKVG